MKNITWSLANENEKNEESTHHVKSSNSSQNHLLEKDDCYNFYFIFSVGKVKKFQLEENFDDWLEGGKLGRIPTNTNEYLFFE